MDFFDLIFSNHVLLCAGLSWFIAQLLKTLIHLLLERRFSMERMVGAGGMPSSHTSTIVSLSVAVGFVEGFDSAMFAMGAVMTFIVMHDASRVRYSVGQHARLINKMLVESFKGGVVHHEKLKELIGHKPLEVYAGAVLGIIVSVVYFSIV